MRRLLASLLCFVFLQSQVFAIFGLPSFGNGAAASITGTWSGVLIPSATAPNTLGIFSVAVPTKGFTQGAVFVFNNGLLFQGSMVGVADPGKKTFNSIIHAVHVTSSSTSTGGFGNTIQIAYDQSADGLLKASIVSSNISGLGLRLNGTATTQVVNINTNTNGPNFTFTVDGFLQSTEVSTTSATSIAGLLSGLGG